MESRGYPDYWLYEGKPVILVEGSGYTPNSWALNSGTGEFEFRPEYRVKLQHGPADIDHLNREEFIQAVEEIRGERAVLWRQGPQVSDALRAIYETILAIVGPPSNPKYPLTDEELALVQVLRKRTFEMFEAELRERGGVGMPG